MMLCRNFSQWTHPIHSIGPDTHVLGRFAPFRYSIKDGAKRAELVPLTHKFAKRCCIGIFRSERTRSTPLDPKQIFWGRFALFHCCTKVDAKLDELVPLTHQFAKWTCVGIFHNERTRSGPFDPILMFWGVSHLFVTAWKSVPNEPNWGH
jgi:hypothetical protein